MPVITVNCITILRTHPDDQLHIIAKHFITLVHFRGKLEGTGYLVWIDRSVYDILGNVNRVVRGLSVKTKTKRQSSVNLLTAF